MHGTTSLKLRDLTLGVLSAVGLTPAKATKFTPTEDKLLVM